MSKRAAGTPKTVLSIPVRIDDEPASSPVTWSLLAVEQQTLVCSRRLLHAQPVIPPGYAKRRAEDLAGQIGVCMARTSQYDPRSSMHLNSHLDRLSIIFSKNNSFGTRARVATQACLTRLLSPCGEIGINCNTGSQPIEASSTNCTSRAFRARPTSSLARQS